MRFFSFVCQIALVWQLMQAYVISLLQKLGTCGVAVGDADIVRWANSKVGVKEIFYVDVKIINF